MLCKTCKTEKDATQFMQDFRTESGISKTCLACKAAAKGMSQEDFEWSLLTNQRASHKNTSDEKKARNKIWRTENRDRVNSRVRIWQKNNPEVLARNNHRRKARKSATTENIFTEEDKRQLLIEYAGLCAYCGNPAIPLEMDHVVPLSQGGKHTKSNIVPTCKRCNRSKAGRTPDQANMQLRKLNMNAYDYQMLAARTLVNKPTQPLTDEEIMMLWTSIGIAGEAGEVVDLVKKVVFHRHTLDRHELKKELGDVLWYVAGLASVLGIDLGDIMNDNIEKLKARYPEGFSTEDSINRSE